MHLHQLVDQHVAGGADFAGVAQAAAQQKRLAVGAAIGELGKVQVDAGDAVERQRARVGIVGQGYLVFLAFNTGGVCGSSYIFIVFDLLSFGSGFGRAGGAGAGGVSGQLERVLADAAQGVDEGFAAGTGGAIGI